MGSSHVAYLEVEHLPAIRSCLRIAVVTETYPPEVNGVALTLAQLITALERHGHEIQLIRPRQIPFDTGDRNPRCDEVLMRGLPLPRYPHLRMGVPCKRALVRLWSTHRPDIVHIATEGPLGWSALQAARRLKLPVSSDFRTNFHAYTAHYGVGWLRKPILGYLRKFHNATGCTMVPTEALRAELERSGLRGLAVVARGVDTQRFDPRRRSAELRQRWGALDEDDLVVLYVGRLAAEKNLGTLATTFDAVRAAVPAARFVVVGDGPERDALRTACPYAHFTGERHGIDLAAHYASADLLLFPSCTETFGNVTTEAMASALAVVAFDHAAAGQLIRSGHNGALAPLTDVGALAPLTDVGALAPLADVGALAPRADVDAFTRAAVNLACDGVRRRAIGAAARETVLPLGWAVIAMRFETALRQVIRQHAAPAPSAVGVGERAAV